MIAKLNFPYKIATIMFQPNYLIMNHQQIWKSRLSKPEMLILRTHSVNNIERAYSNIECVSKSHIGPSSSNFSQEAVRRKP